MVSAGRLYVHVREDVVLPGNADIEAVVDSSLETFRRAEIEFTDAQIVSGSTLPKLEGIDIFMYLLDRFYEDQSLLGKFGMNESHIQNLDESGRIPTYDEATAQTHCGYVKLPGSIMFQYHGINPNSARTKLENVLTHEIGHGLGASHVMQKVMGREGIITTLAYGHVMGQCTGTAINFHDANVAQMHGFIDGARSDGFDREKVNARRNYLLSNAHDVTKRI